MSERPPKTSVGCLAALGWGRRCQTECRKPSPYLANVNSTKYNKEKHVFYKLDKCLDYIYIYTSTISSEIVKLIFLESRIHYKNHIHTYIY